jgi:hypothetical protein
MTSRGLVRSAAVLGAVSLGIVLVVACDDSGSSGGGGGTPCQQLQNAMCAKLRACPEAPGSNECSYVGNEGGRRGINCSACDINFSRDICGDTTKSDEFFTTCLAAVNAGKATCDPNGADPGAGLKLPPECNGFLTCGAGPCKS